MGAGHRAALRRGRHRDRRARGLARARGEGARPDRALPHAQGREGPARAGRARRRRRALDDHDRPRRSRRLRPRDRGDRRGARAEAGALRRARAHLPAGRGARDEHVGALGDRDRGRRRRSPERVVGMHFFNPAPLMPLVEIVRAELHLRRGRRYGVRARRAARQASDPLPRHAGLRRQPRADPAAERLRPRARRGARDASRISTRG